MKIYSQVEFAYIDIDQCPEVGSAYSVFICPTIIVFIEGKETIRESKFIFLSDIEEKLTRYLELIK